MPQATGVLIIGGGQAGFELARSLRSLGYNETIRIVAGEDDLPYQRPPLSKSFLAGELDRTGLHFAAEKFFTESNIELVQGPAAVVDLKTRTVATAIGAALNYDHLVFATGARNRILPGTENISGLHAIRTLADAGRLVDSIMSAKNIMVIGAGFLGLEVASTLAISGQTVHVVEAQGRVMARTSSPAVSAYFERKISALGVRIDVGRRGIAIDYDGSCITGVRWAGGAAKPDVLLACIGVVPNEELAQAAGIPCANGICVNEHLEVPSVPNVYAIGDCASFPSRHFGGMTRLESVQNAVDQAASVARSILGDRSPYTSVPWFWSEQGKSKLQIVADCRGDAELMIGSPESNQFTIFHFRDDRLIGAESVNQPKEHMRARRLLREGEPRLSKLDLQQRLQAS